MGKRDETAVDKRRKRRYHRLERYEKKARKAAAKEAVKREKARRKTEKREKRKPRNEQKSIAGERIVQRQGKTHLEHTARQKAVRSSMSGSQKKENKKAKPIKIKMKVLDIIQVM